MFRTSLHRNSWTVGNSSEQMDGVMGETIRSGQGKIRGR